MAFIDFGYQHSSKYILLCSTEQRTPYMFGTTWVSNDKIKILGWIIPLRQMLIDLLVLSNPNGF